MRNNGVAESTITATSYKLRQLAKACILNNPEEVKAAIATAKNAKTNQPLNNSSKAKFAECYNRYAKVMNITWQKPIYKVPEPIPPIPTKEDITAIIGSAGKAYTTIFTIFTEVAANPIELANVTQKDIDTEHGIINITGVKKHGSGRYTLKPRTAEMLRLYLSEHPEEHPFPRAHIMSQAWTKTRRRTFKKLGKPDQKIELRHLRNYSGMIHYLSQPVRDPWATMRHFRHKKMDTTQHYLQAMIITYEEDDQWISLVTHSPEEECKAIEKGYQLVRAINETTAIYRKRK